MFAFLSGEMMFNSFGLSHLPPATLIVSSATLSPRR